MSFLRASAPDPLLSPMALGTYMLFSSPVGSCKSAKTSLIIFSSASLVASSIALLSESGFKSPDATPSRSPYDETT
jgi:hypothetical protein